jgi:acetyltransferase
MSDFIKLTQPEKIAVIGASTDPGKIGYQIVNNLKRGGFEGEILPINPKYDQILGLKTYPDVNDYSGNIDLAIIVIPAAFVEAVLEKCGQIGIPAAIVISAGFAESGDDGKQRQEGLMRICQSYNMTVLGPNCLGLLNADNKMNASFAIDMPLSGKISVLSQSGAIISAIIDWSKNSFCGFNKIFSLGNKAALGESDLLEFLYNDPKTEVVAMYLEQLEADDNLSRLLLSNSKIKPTIVLYGGKTGFGAKAAASHTGSIVSSYVAVKAYFEQLGVIVAEDMREFFDLCKLFSSYKHIDNEQIAIVTNAGGPGIAASDSASKQSLTLPELDSGTIEKLRQFLPSEASFKNPIDMLGDASDERYRSTIEAVLEDKNISGILALLTPQTSTKIDETAIAIGNINASKPLISSFIGGASVSKPIIDLQKSGKPVYEYPEEAIRMMKKLDRHSNKPNLFIIPDSIKNKHLDPAEKEAALKEYQLPVLEYCRVENDEQLIGSANQLGYPLVLKTAKSETAHKSDEGGVILNIQNEDELKDAYARIGAPAIIGKMIVREQELFVGIKREKNVGVVITFGTGGIYSEIMKDFSYRIAPLNLEMALEMIGETKIGQIISGARNQKKYDLTKLAGILVNISWFALEYQNIKEIDFNPILASGDDYFIVDARVICE